MNDEGALYRRPRHQLSRRSEVSTGAGWVTPRLILEIPIECCGELRIVADSHENELRLRRWLRRALDRRSSLSEEIVRWLDELDEREAA